MQYFCVQRWFFRWLLTAVALLGVAPSVAAQSDRIYRTVGPDGTVSYSDQPATGATEVPDLLVRPATAAERSAAHARADARISQQLELATELAEQRQARSDARDNAALVRARLRESRAREQALAEQVQRDANYRDRYAPQFWFPQRRHYQDRHQYRHQNRRSYHLDPPAPLQPEPEPRQSRPLPPG